MKRKTWENKRAQALVKIGKRNLKKPIYDTWMEYLAKERKRLTIKKIAVKTGLSYSAICGDLKLLGINKRQNIRREHVKPCGCCAENYQAEKWDQHATKEWRDLA